MRLELGSGERPTEGFVHLDNRPNLPDLDLIDDASTLELVEPGSCDEIRACHLLEHFSHLDTHRILRLWLGRLRPGGELYLEVPNMRGHIEAWYRRGETDEELVHFLYGGQEYPGNFHATGFTPASLDKALRVAGYRNVQVRNFGLALAATGTR